MMAGMPPIPPALAALAGAPPSGAPAPGIPPAMASATGAPPPMMMGKVPTGSGSIDPHVAASTAIQNLKELKGQFPKSSSEIDAMIAQVRMFAGDAPSAGAPSPDTPDESGPPAP